MAHKGNSLCRSIGHSWLGSSSVGWCVCDRPHCGAIGACPACLGYRLAGVLDAFCLAHQAYEPYVNDYPVAQGVEAAASSQDPDPYAPGTMW